MSATPLHGLRILVTRPGHQSHSLIEHLRQLGAEPVEFPLIATAELEDYRDLDRALTREYEWVIFTSVNAVTAVFRRLQERGGHLTAAKAAAVGRATAKALAEHGKRAEFVPHDYTAEAILSGMGDVARMRILLPQADIARRELADGLRSRGAIVDAIVAYRTVPSELSSADLERVLDHGVDLVTFFSPSAVRRFASLVPQRRLDTWSVACVGPATASAAREIGFRVEVTADDHTTEGLIDAIRRRLSVLA